MAHKNIKIANKLQNPEIQSNVVIGNVALGNCSQAGLSLPIEILKRGLNFGGFKEFEEVLAVSDDGKLTVNPQGASVEATVEAHGKDKKIIVYKYKPKKGYHKKRRKAVIP